MQNDPAPDRADFGLLQFEATEPYRPNNSQPVAEQERHEEYDGERQLASSHSLREPSDPPHTSTAS